MAGVRRLRSCCTFTALVGAAFALYVAVLGHSLWTLFNPGVHVGPGEGHAPAWTLDGLVDLHLYVSFNPNAYGEVLHTVRDISILDVHSSVVEVRVPKKALRGQPWYLHAIVARAGRPPLPLGTEYRPDDVARRTQALTARAPCRRNTTRTLLASQEGPTPAGPLGEECPFLKPKVVVRLIRDDTHYPFNGIPQDVFGFIQFAGRRYKPIVYLDETWLLREHLFPLNDTARNLTLEVEYRPMALGVWRMLRHFDEALKMLEGYVGKDSEEPDNLRRMATETPPWLLAVTFAVTLVHLMFDVLAFKNDIAFWRGRKSMEGLSTNNVVAGLVCEAIIAVYLWNNNTGWPILLPCAVGLVIQFWKAGIALRLKGAGKDSSTARADAQATRWLSYALYPLVLAYAIYSLLYKEHTNWFSWALESLASAVYAFGFVLMTPQLYINYKLKSVANLPWRVFVYRACNTFIDDLFAFIIRMPTLHRLSAFRDDVVFLVYLFQRWQYPVDPTRREGFAGEDDDHHPLPEPEPESGTGEADAPPGGKDGAAKKDD
jgi:hypothetical protein